MSFRPYGARRTMAISGWQKVKWWQLCVSYYREEVKLSTVAKVSTGSFVILRNESELLSITLLIGQQESYGSLICVDLYDKDNVLKVVQLL